MDLKGFGRKYGPDILSGLATIGVGLTAVLSGWAAVKSYKKLEDGKIRAGKEKAKETWKYYILPVLSGGLTIAGIWGSRKMSASQLASVAAAAGYMISTRKKRVEKEELDDVPAEQTIEETGNGNIVCIEAFSGRIFKSSEEAVNNAVHDLEDSYRYDMETHGFAYAALNDLYSYLNIQTTYFGDQVGWCNEEHGEHIYFVTYWADLEKLGRVFVVEPADQSMPIMNYQFY